MKRRPPKEIALKTNELACSMGIDHLLDRQPAGLSGGEQQRIALPGLWRPILTSSC
ncbi:MAG: hypothetical protein R3F31_20415 [Verrucomicrobiales bacterium]